jgi:tripeptide aminopeptidase
MHSASLSDRPSVRAARTSIQAEDAGTIAEQLRIVAIPAPTGAETARAEYVARRFREIGLVDVERDEVGNVLGWNPGGDGAPVIVSAHLDTVFSADVPVAPRTRDGRLYAPGVTDNARGLAALLTLAGVATRLELRTAAPVAFVATVGEEGIGDLRGAKHLFRPDGPFAQAAAFIALDGSGLRRVVHRAVGSRRVRVHVSGPGGHSWSDWGAANPIHALGAAIAELARITVASDPPATLTVAKIGGGTSINAIPEHAWMDVDLRGEAPEGLARLEAQFRTRALAAVAAENERRRELTPGLRLSFEVIGDRPAGQTPAAHPLVRAAIRATRDVGASAELVASSTDANIPMALKIPAVTVGAGGESGGVHTVDEWFENRGGALGVERALLLMLDQAGFAG